MLAGMEQEEAGCDGAPHRLHGEAWRAANMRQYISLSMETQSVFSLVCCSLAAASEAKWM